MFHFLPFPVFPTTPDVLFARFHLSLKSSLCTLGLRILLVCDAVFLTIG